MSRKPEHICKQKAPHADEAAALLAITALREKGATGDLRAFQCAVCRRWHVGRWTPRAAFYNAGLTAPRRGKRRGKRKSEHVAGCE